MRSEAHLDVAPADLRGQHALRHAAAKHDAGRTFVVAVGLGWPRLWRFATSAVLEGFAEGLTRSGTQRGAARLRTSMLAAREKLVERCNGLIERETPDAALLGVTLDNGELHVHAVGPCRAYVHRKGESQRLTPRIESDTGLIASEIVESSMWLDPGDLVLAGSVSAFSTNAVGRVAAVLKQDPDTAPSVLCTLLTDPAGEAGVGAAAVVLRTH